MEVSVRRERKVLLLVALLTIAFMAGYWFRGTLYSKEKEGTTWASQLGENVTGQPEVGGQQLADAILLLYRGEPPCGLLFASPEAAETYVSWNDEFRAGRLFAFRAETEAPSAHGVIPWKRTALATDPESAAY
jgi:hypothetical protein